MADNAIALFSQAKSLLESGALEKALPLFAKVVALDPGHAWAFFHYGEALDQSGKPDDALEAFRTAIKLDEGIAQEQIDMGLESLLQGAFAKAIKEFKSKQTGIEELEVGGQNANINIDDILRRKSQTQETPSAGDPMGGVEFAAPPASDPVGGGFSDPMGEMTFDAPQSSPMAEPTFSPMDDPMSGMAFEPPPSTPSPGGFGGADLDPMADMSFEPPPPPLTPVVGDPMADLVFEPEPPPPVSSPAPPVPTSEPISELTDLFDATPTEITGEFEDSPTIAMDFPPEAIPEMSFEADQDFHFDTEPLAEPDPPTVEPIVEPPPPAPLNPVEDLFQDLPAEPEVEENFAMDATVVMEIPAELAIEPPPPPPVAAPNIERAAQAAPPLPKPAPAPPPKEVKTEPEMVMDELADLFPPSDPTLAAPKFHDGPPTPTSTFSDLERPGTKVFASIDDDFFPAPPSTPGKVDTDDDPFAEVFSPGMEPDIGLSASPAPEPTPTQASLDDHSDFSPTPEPFSPTPASAPPLEVTHEDGDSFLGGDPLEFDPLASAISAPVIPVDNAEVEDGFDFGSALGGDPLDLETGTPGEFSPSPAAAIPDVDDDFGGGLGGDPLDLEPDLGPSPVAIVSSYEPPPIDDFDGGLGGDPLEFDPHATDLTTPPSATPILGDEEVDNFAFGGNQELEDVPAGRSVGPRMEEFVGDEEDSFSFGASSDEIDTPTVEDSTDDEFSTMDADPGMDVDINITQWADPDSAGKEIKPEMEDTLGRDLGMDNFWEQPGEEAVAFGGKPDPDEESEPLPPPEVEPEGDDFMDMLTAESNTKRGAAPPPEAEKLQKPAPPPKPEPEAPSSYGDDFLASLGVDLAPEELPYDPPPVSKTLTTVIATPTESWASMLDDMEHPPEEHPGTTPWKTSVFQIPKEVEEPAIETVAESFDTEFSFDEKPIDSGLESFSAESAGGLSFEVSSPSPATAPQPIIEESQPMALDLPSTDYHEEEEEGVSSETQTLRWLNPIQGEMPTGSSYEIQIRVDDLYGVAVEGETIVGEIIDKDLDGLTFLTPDKREGISVLITETHADIHGIATFAVQLARGAGSNEIKISTMHSAPLIVAISTQGKEAAKLLISPKGGQVPGGLTSTAKIKALDRNNNPVSGIHVEFLVMEHEGDLPTFLGSMGGRTDNEGEYKLQFQMPKTPGSKVRLAARCKTVQSISVSPLEMEVREARVGDPGGLAGNLNKKIDFSALLAKLPFLNRKKGSQQGASLKERVQAKLNPSSSLHVKTTRKHLDMGLATQRVMQSAILLGLLLAIGLGGSFIHKNFVKPALLENKIGKALAENNFPKLEELYKEKLTFLQEKKSDVPTMDTILNQLGKNRVDWAKSLMGSNPAEGKAKAAQALYAYLDHNRSSLMLNKTMEKDLKVLGELALKASPERRTQVRDMLMGLGNAYSIRSNPGDCLKAADAYRRALIVSGQPDESVEKEIANLKSRKGC